MAGVGIAKNSCKFGKVARESKPTQKKRTHQHVKSQRVVRARKCWSKLLGYDIGCDDRAKFVWREARHGLGRPGPVTRAAMCNLLLATDYEPRTSRKAVLACR